MTITATHSSLLCFIATISRVFTCKLLKYSCNYVTLADPSLVIYHTLSLCFSDLVLPEVFEFDVKWIYFRWYHQQHCSFPSDLFLFVMDVCHLIQTFKTI